MPNNPLFFWFWAVITFIMGVNVGSFLNVVIWRLPRGGSILEPQFSYCPHCKQQLQPIDLIPLFSFLFLGRRCRRCKKPISWRYFGVELLTGVLFLALYFRFTGDIPTAVCLIIFAALLVPITFIDLEHFIIPISLNLLAFIVAVGRDIWGIIQHEPGHELLGGWMPRSVLGAIAGILIFGMVRIVGWIWKRVEAMGLGDVYLARAMGAMLVSVTPADWPPMALFPIWVLLSCLSGLVVGPLLIFLRRQQAKKTSQEPQEEEGEEQAEEESTFIQQLRDVGECLILADLWETLAILLKIRKVPAEEASPNVPLIEDDWEPAPTAIPFGPFLAIGFLATIFIGEAFTRWYYLSFVALPNR